MLPTDDYLMGGYGDGGKTQELEAEERILAEFWPSVLFPLAVEPEWIGEGRT